MLVLFVYIHLYVSNSCLFSLPLSLALFLQSIYKKEPKCKWNEKKNSNVLRVCVAAFFYEWEHKIYLLNAKIFFSKIHSKSSFCCLLSIGNQISLSKKLLIKNCFLVGNTESLKTQIKCLFIYFWLRENYLINWVECFRNWVSEYKLLFLLLLLTRSFYAEITLAASFCFTVCQL